MLKQCQRLSFQSNQSLQCKRNKLLSKHFNTRTQYSIQKRRQLKVCSQLDVDEDIRRLVRKNKKQIRVQDNSDFSQDSNISIKEATEQLSTPQQQQNQREQVEQQQLQAPEQTKQGMRVRKKLSKKGIKEPQTCSEAIALGLEQFQKGQVERAIDCFSLSLELPGYGVVRYEGSLREYSCPSEKEQQTALFNMVCCYSKLNIKESAYACVEGLFDAEFNQFELLQKDPDLQNIQGEKLDQMISKQKFEKLKKNLDKPRNFIDNIRKSFQRKK